MYLGTYAFSIDEKRRTQIPSKWRPENQEMEFAVILTNQHQAGACLRVMEPKQLEALHARLKAMPSEDPRKDTWMRQLGGNSEIVTLDKAGRITLPPRFAEEAGLKGEALVVGMFEQFEIWNPERHAQAQTVDSSITRGSMLSLS